MIRSLLCSGVDGFVEDLYPHIFNVFYELKTSVTGRHRLDTYVACSQSKFPWCRLQKQKPNLMETFIGTDTASVELFFNIFITGIEKFVIPWDQRLYSPVAELWRLGLELLCYTHLRLPVIFKTLTLTRQELLEV